MVPVFGQNDQTFVVGMQVAHRADLAPEVQSVITKYGGDIVGRFGIPSFDKDRGLIVLLMHEAAAVDRLTDELKDFSDLQVKTVAFD